MRERNLPATGSLSVTLDDLYTDMAVSNSTAESSDSLVVNGRGRPELLPRVIEAAWTM